MMIFNNYFRFCLCGIMKVVFFSLLEYWQRLFSFKFSVHVKFYLEYENQQTLSVKLSWSVRELKRQIDTSLFERLVLLDGNANKEKVLEVLILRRLLQNMHLGDWKTRFSHQNMFTIFQIRMSL